MSEVHVLNGDALLDQFPESISGERLAMRECMIEGPLNSATLDSFYQDRMAFLSFQYQTAEETYKTRTIAEFEKLAKLPADHQINLWFEQDLFCQANLWFVCAYLVLHHKSNAVYLIMPTSFSNDGFGGLNSRELSSLYDDKKPFRHLKEFAALWEFYRLGKNTELQQLAVELTGTYPYLKEAVQAHLDRLRTGDSLGRPINSLIRIINDLDTTEFGPVFQEFCVREGIYGFGDSQVKRFFDEIITSRLHKGRV
jgi:hypothetical protein